MKSYCITCKKETPIIIRADKIRGSRVYIYGECSYCGGRIVKIRGKEYKK